eukprot:TRINITY_DN26969_c0_g1_i1.p1 TRINITY_DN26969_c0_g1~~TRINITY_DN26969_c0_g1_i1.p1  ORF type:complete len:255 (+),score=41.84 TRINITY_DN26969_c0_g1_i1:71-766(+)
MALGAAAAVHTAEPSAEVVSQAAAAVADDGDGVRGEIVKALAKQLTLPESAVERIFDAGAEFAERRHKRRRLSAPEGTESTAAPSADGTENGAGYSGFTPTVTLEQLRQELTEFAKERDWDQFHSPRNLALALVGEVGELCEIFQWKGEVPEGLPGWNEKQRTHVGQECADILLYLLRLSHKCHLDLPKCALDKLALNAAKYPASLVRGRSEKYTEYKGGSAAAAARPSAA